MAFLDKLKTQAAAAQAVVATVGSESLQAGLEALKASLDDLDSFLSKIEEAGYELVKLEVGMDVPPTVKVNFKAHQEVDAAKLEKIIHDNPDKKLLTVILVALLQANKIRESVHVGKLAVDDIEILVKAVPSVTVTFE